MFSPGSDIPKQGSSFVHRKSPRFAIAMAVISYKKSGFWQRRINFAGDAKCPVLDISKGGLSFLTDRPPKSRRVSLLLKYSERDDAINLEGTIVYSVPRGDELYYRYRVGVKFNPFSSRRGHNALDALFLLDRLEKTYGRLISPPMPPDTPVNPAR